LSDLDEETPSSNNKH